MFAYLATKLLTRFTLAAQAITTTQTGTAVYTGDMEGPIEVSVSAPVTNQGTITVTIDSSVDNSSWTANVLTLLEDPTTGVSASFAVITSAVALSKTLVIPKTICPPYIRLVATCSGSPTGAICAFVNALSKYN